MTVLPHMRMLAHIRVSDVPYAYRTSHTRMGHNIALYAYMGVRYEYIYMLYSQKQASSVVHFKMAGSCSDICFPAACRDACFPQTGVSLNVYRDECMPPRRTCSYDQLPTSHSDICVPGNYACSYIFRSGKLISSRRFNPVSFLIAVD